MATQTQQAITALDTLVKQNGALIENQAAPALEAEIGAGKASIVAALVAKGVPATSSDTLAELADKIADVQTEEITIDGGEFYPANMLGTSIYNLFEIAAYIKSKYVSSGRFAGAIIAQYYKGYATLNLAAYGGGYAACETCDGDYYANDGDSTPIGVHTWHDNDTGKQDRWVAFLYLADDFDFISTQSGLCPREILVVGQCASIQINYNRLVNVYSPAVFGSLGNFRLVGSDSPQGAWSSVQSWEYYREHTQGNIFQNNNVIIFVEFANLALVSGGNLLSISSNNNSPALTSLSLPALQTVSGGSLLNMGGGGNNNFSALTSLSLPALQTVSGGNLLNMGGNGNNFSALTSLSLPALQTVSGGSLLSISGGGNNFSALTSLSLPALQTVSGSGDSGYICKSSKTPLLDVFLPVLREMAYVRQENRHCPIAAKRVYAPMLEWGYLTVRGSSGNYDSIEYLLAGCKGEPTQELNIYAYSTPPVFDLEIGDKEMIDKNEQPRWQPRMKITLVNITVLTAENIALHILDRLGDNSDGATITITIGSTNLNRILADATYAPYVAAATAKNYTIA